MTGRQASALVSVIVPVHDRFELAERALRSVAGQTHGPIELIVVDDSSSPPFVLPPGVFAGASRVVRLASNRGPGAAREAGRGLATGDYVAYLDSDDFWAPAHVASLVAALSGAPDAGMAYSLAMEMRQGRPSSLRRGSEEEHDRIFPILLWRRPWHTSACLWRRELTDRMGGWGTTWHWEDHEHDARAGCLDARLVRIPEATCFVEVDSADRLSASASARRRIESYGLAMLSIARRIRRSAWFDDPAVRRRMREILLGAAVQASEQRLRGIAARTALASWRWPFPPASLVVATGAALPLLGLKGGRASARILRWARRRVQSRIPTAVPQ